jgi:alpha-D-ribose 1-methylphosphonate 5-triphosphate synthase subunit PhnH
VVRSHAIQWLPIAAEDPAPGTFQAVVTALKHPGAAVHLPQLDSLPWPRYLPFGIDVFFTRTDTLVALPRGLQLT